MKQYRVKIYPAATQDLIEVVETLSSLSPSAALRVYDQIVDEIEKLSFMPERWPRPRDLALAAKGYRCLVVEKYLVFYVIDGDIVQVRRILYGKRNYRALL